MLNTLISDEFDEPVLDQTKWHVQGTDGFYQSNFIGRAPSQFSLDNVRLEDGKLKIQTRSDSAAPCPRSIPQRLHRRPAALAVQVDQARLGLPPPALG